MLEKTTKFNDWQAKFVMDRIPKELHNLFFTKVPEEKGLRSMLRISAAESDEEKSRIIAETEEFSSENALQTLRSVRNNAELQKKVLGKSEKFKSYDAANAFTSIPPNSEVWGLILDKTEELDSWNGMSMLKVTGSDPNVQKRIASLIKEKSLSGNDVANGIKSTEGNHEAQTILLGKIKEGEQLETGDAKTALVFAKGNPDAQKKLFGMMKAGETFYSYDVRDLKGIVSEEAYGEFIEKVSTVGGIRASLQLEKAETIEQKRRILDNINLEQDFFTYDNLADIEDHIPAELFGEFVDKIDPFMGQKALFLLERAKNREEQQKILEGMSEEFRYTYAEKALNHIDPTLRNKFFQKVNNGNGQRTTLELSFAKTTEERDGIIEAMKSEGNKFYSGVNMVKALEATKEDPNIQRKIIELSEANYVSDIGILKAIKATNDETIQEMLLNKGRTADFNTDFDKNYFRSALAYASSQKVFNEILTRNKLSGELGFNVDAMTRIYSEPGFKDKTQDMHPVERWSVALTAQRYLERSGKEFTTENLGNAVDIVKAKRNEVASYRILDSSTTFIPITHDERFDSGEYAFKEESLVELATDSGVNNVVRGLKGADAKSRILDSIESSEGKTTVWFNNHGGSNHQWLTEGFVGSEYSDKMHKGGAISYVELGDSLTKRAKDNSLEDVTIVIDSCYSYDYVVNLYNHLEKKGIQKMPVIITETNRGRVGYMGESFVGGILEEKQKGAPLKIGDIFKAEKHYFDLEDGAIFVPTEEGIESLGSSYDPQHLTEDQKKKIEEENKKIKAIELRHESEPEKKGEYTPPSTVIEIAKIEPEMEEKLSIA